MINGEFDKRCMSGFWEFVVESVEVVLEEVDLCKEG
jgi:hypothetical protein